MAQPWEALLQSPTPVDTTRNPDFDKLMGLDAQLGDDPSTQFIKGLQSSLARNSAQGREVTMEVIKAKLAAQSQLELMKQKMELERQYPTYSAHPTPYGSVIMVNPFDPNDNKEINAMPEAKAGYLAKMQAEAATAKTQTSTEYQSAALAEQVGKPALQQAQIKGQNALAELRPQMALLDQARANAAEIRANAAGQPKPMPDAEAEKEAMHILGLSGNPQHDMFIDPDGSIRAKLPATKQKILQDSRSTNGAPAAASAPASPTGAQIGSLLNFGPDE